jgi:hypothetical protein
MTTTQEWLRDEIPAAIDEAALKAYFGVPPSPDSELQTNIDRKRKVWHKRSNGPQGAERARRVKELIRVLEAHLLRGQPLPDGILDGDVKAEDARPLPPPWFEDLGELLEMVETLLNRGQHQRAADLARNGVERWPNESAALARLAFVCSYLSVLGELNDLTLLEHGLQAAARCNELNPTDTSAWYSRCVLLLAADRADEALALEAEVSVRLGSVPPSILVLIGQAMLSVGRYSDGLQRLVRAVSGAPDDLGIRSEAASAATAAATLLLPLDTPAAVTQYCEIIQVGAWCADGAPAAEDLIRPHRLWAARCTNKAFVGSLRLRTFLAVCTAFVSVPIHNAAKSRPLWQILLQGPPQGQEFFLLSSASYVRMAHAGRSMPWAPSGTPWPVAADFAGSTD